MAYNAMRPDGLAYMPAITASGEERLVFLRKVYSLMFSGLLVFAAMAAAPIVGVQWKIPGLEQVGLLALGIHPLISLGVLIVSSMMLHSIERVRGLNLIALYGMAAVWGFISIRLMAYAWLAGGVEIILQALGLTTLVFGGLTAYVFLSRKDFSFMGGMLTVGSFVLFGSIIVALVMHMAGVHVSVISTAISAFATILFMGYVLYDTSEVLHRYSTDMAVPAALALMVDFIILFRSILILLSSRR